VTGIDTTLLTWFRLRPDKRGTIVSVTWIWVVVLIAVIALVAVLLAGRGDAMRDVFEDRPDVTIATGRPLTADDIREVRLSTGWRGYRMDEVDALLERVQADLLARETGAEPAADATGDPRPAQAPESGSGDLGSAKPAGESADSDADDGGSSTEGPAAPARPGESTAADEPAQAAQPDDSGEQPRPRS
jgi:DivIVA domain-containing protein